MFVVFLRCLLSVLNLETQSNLSYATPDGTIVSDSWAQLTSGSWLSRPINKNQHGANIVGEPAAWAGVVDISGQNFVGPGEGNCNNWTRNAATDWAYTLRADDVQYYYDGNPRPRGCNRNLRLMCFQQDCYAATAGPTRSPTGVPTRTPTAAPTATPTRVPTAVPTTNPTTSALPVLPFVSQFAFVTSQLFTGGQIGSVEGAHAKCAAAAAASTEPQISAITSWKAWISNSTTGPVHFMPRSRVPLYTSGGNLVVNCPAWEWLPADTQDLINPFSEDEHGNAVPFVGGDIWTGTDIDRTPQGTFHCNDWTSSSALVTGVVGTSYDTSLTWAYGSDESCDVGRRLLCMQADIPVIPPGQAMRFFTTSASYDGSFGGLAGADALCTTHATDIASIPSLAASTWKAWLDVDSPASYPAIRFTLSPSVPIVGACYEPFAANFSSMGATGKPEATRIDEMGSYITAPGVKAWTNAANNGQASIYGPLACGNWTSSSALDQGRFGVTSNTDQWSDSNNESCDNLNRLYCFAQAPVNTGG